MDELAVDLEKLEQGSLPDAVGEMMARSGGFNVPADYFRSSAMPAPVPGRPPSTKQRWPLYATIGAVGSAVGIVAVVLSRSPSSTAQVPAATSAPVVVAPPVTAPPESASAAPVVSAPAPVLHDVLVTVAPSDANVFRDGKDLGPAPIILRLGDGETASLVLTHKGYRPKTVSVDPTTPRQSFALDTAYTPSARPVSAAPAGGGGIDDVGDPFAKKR
jgi:serine/threonine-protein kinase